ncbi:trehalose-phosphatase [Fodinicola acaciae]|uniref:trehalose-phosphatase n=1 Tax=Fodinicola acaciae TaxID=2681555 RepID=UPI0013D63B9E|nr:trehalose-phosphatase [Fodinicola acaciae]
MTGLAELARTAKLLVATDFDGVLAPIVSVPAAARALPASVEALRALGSLPDTEIAVVSGRSLEVLRRLLSPPDEWHLVGSHGAETTDNTMDMEAVRPAAVKLAATLEHLVGARPGVAIEPKPIGAAVHVRNAAPDIASAVLEEVRSGPATEPGIFVTEGKCVIELAVVEVSKGIAVNQLRDALSATAVLYAGDDVTDERAFRALRDGDLGVKVGPGETAASLRVEDPEAMAAFFEELLALRSAGR